MQPLLHTRRYIIPRLPPVSLHTPAASPSHRTTLHLSKPQNGKTKPADPTPLTVYRSMRLSAVEDTAVQYGGLYGVLSLQPDSYLVLVLP